MRLAMAQTGAVIGDLTTNLKRHVDLARLAAANRVDALLFSELSLVGYEPTIAAAVAVERDDARLDPLALLADETGMTIMAGAPIATSATPLIGLIIFRPNQARAIYAKQYLHDDELPFFSAGPRAAGIIAGPQPIGLAICYELSVIDHAEQTIGAGAALYVASVAKLPSGMAGARARLSTIAAQYRVPAMMVNCVGLCEGRQAAGGSAVWDEQGTLLAALDDQREGLLIYDRTSGQTTALRDPA